eukprot:CAMPEP_0117669952 /NCGR_PEP_ID=MMETSP0804-20121206/12445_1 /TAXON_ID=1074897 /ORGANISM="Tetraselmis astigmatica, Strain CCMP880" /LENGTH=186 /DNA_ID=CAMNT_0005478121 /DNA_START=207 /DNA_END=767 /DNA_ORIENTATION=-
MHGRRFQLQRSAREFHVLRAKWPFARPAVGLPPVDQLLPSHPHQHKIGKANKERVASFDNIIHDADLVHPQSSAALTTCGIEWERDLPNAAERRNTLLYTSRCTSAGKGQVLFMRKAEPRQLEDPVHAAVLLELPQHVDGEGNREHSCTSRDWRRGSLGMMAGRQDRPPRAMWDAKGGDPLRRKGH